MNFQILSDLHLEKRKLPFTITPKAPILILAGDIDSYPFTSLDSLLPQLSHDFEYVFYVPGNHEYHSDLNLPIQYINSFLTTLIKPYNNIHFLNNTTFEINNFIFAGTILWSFIPPSKIQLYQNSISDYQHINIDHNYPLTPQSQNFLFHDNTYWLDNLVEYAQSNNKQLIIISHYAPSFSKTLQPQFINDPLNHVFCSNLTYLLKHPVKAWVFGHTHHFTNELINSTTHLISNPLGKPTENTGFDPDFTVKIN